MNPLEDIIVALQPMTPQLPWPLPNSVRMNEVNGIGNMFTNLNPFSNGGANTVDGPTNFGWEYVWHCHILGHEENDMMRPILWQVPPNAPGPLTAAANVNGGVDISFTDNSASETGFVVQRDTDPAFPAPAIIQVAASPTQNVIGEGVDYGSTIKVTDPTPLVSGSTYYYRAQAIDDGFNLPYEQIYNTTSALLSGWSNTATISPVPIIAVVPTSLAFGTVAVGSSSTSAPVVISNTGTATLNITSITSSAPDFVPTLCTSVPAGQTCTFTVTFSPSAGGPQSATLTIASNDPARPSVLVAMTGTGVVGTNMTITAPAITYGGNGVITVHVAQTTGTVAPAGNVTLSVDGGQPMTALSASSATFNIVTPTAGSHTLVANYAAQNGFQASAANGTLVVNSAPLTITASSGSMIYGGPVPTITPSFGGFVLGQSNLTALTTQPTCSTTATSASPVTSYPSNCSSAVAPNYAITYVAGTVTVTKASSTTAILSNLPNPSIIGQIVTIQYAVTPQFPGSAVKGSVTVLASTGESCSATPASGACTITFQTGGTRTLTATYSGDGNVNGSASAAVTERVSSVSLSTTSLLFGNQVVGSISAAQQVTLANVGTTTLTISNIQWSSNFSDSNNCGGSLAPGRSCRINVRFAPTTTGVLTGTLTITDSDITSPQVITLTGTGVQAAAALSPTSFNFGTVARRSSSTTTFTLTNSGTSSLTINSISIGGANANQFSIPSRTCGNSLGVGASCTINVQFSPRNAGTYNANLQVGDNAPNSPQTATLTGTGQ